MDIVQRLLMEARSQRLKERKLRLPKLKAPKLVGLEASYASKLRKYQRSMNAQFMESLKPLVESFRVDASTEEIEAFAETSARWTKETVLKGAVLRSIVANQASIILRSNHFRWNRNLFKILGLNNSPAVDETALLQSWTIENIKLIKDVSDKQIQAIEGTLLRAGRTGLKPGQLTEQIQQFMGSTLRRATLIARDQTLKLNGQIDRAKQLGAGINHFIWRTTGDERVRKDHRARNGMRYSWAHGADGIYPGQEIQCRCWAEPDLQALLGDEYRPAGPGPQKKPNNPRR